MRLVSAAVFAASLLAPAAHAGQPVVVELFTSQSCSSCPPADALLAELQRGRPDVLPLDFHVDYWDHLGWKDPYSSADATKRQRRYSELLGTHEVYTPQMVIDGTRQAVGSDRDEVENAINAAVADRTHGSAVAVNVADAGANVVVTAGQGAGEGTLWLISFDNQHTTRVRGGENGGRTLTEVNVVRSLQPAGQWRGAPVQLSVPRPAGERTAVLLQGTDGKILAAAVTAAE